MLARTYTSVSAARNGETLALTVSDTGPGVPDHLRTRLFEPFFSTKSGRATSGMGLGLTLVRRATMALGGTVELQDGSRDGGGGAVFVVHIPIPPVSAAAAEAERVEPEVEAPLPAGVTLSPNRAAMTPVQPQTPAS